MTDAHIYIMTALGNCLVTDKKEYTYIQCKYNTITLPMLLYEHIVKSKEF